MKRFFHLIALLLALALPQIAQAELSLESLEMVEALRGHLSQVAVKTDISRPDNHLKTQQNNLSPSDYVVGAELREALKRLRIKVYGNTELHSEADNRSEPETTFPEKFADRTQKLANAVEETRILELYVPGLMLRQALARVQAARPVDAISSEMVPQPVTEIVDPPANLVSAPTQEGTEKNSEQVEVLTEPAPTKDTEIAITAKPMVKATVKIANTKPIEETKVAPSKVRENGPEKSSAVPFTMNEEDHRINREIKEHEFKMPKSYIIIVR